MGKQRPTRKTFFEMKTVWPGSSGAMKTEILGFLGKNPDALTKQWVKVTVYESGKIGGRYTSTIRIGLPHFGRADETAEIAADEVAGSVKRHSFYRIDRVSLQFFDPPDRTGPSMDRV